ncbi:hypothetical protein B0H13DRAFT_2314418 [Mycena leptocephala]|nr:hypothetical protein B0H13DRAFT_2314418 [Mycena leptocephala]
MSLDAAIFVAGLTPVVGLSAAFTVLKIIISCVQEVLASQKQLSTPWSASGSDSEGVWVVQINGSILRPTPQGSLMSCISALLNLQRMLQENERARTEDVNVLNARFDVLENNYIKLRRTR